MSFDLFGSILNGWCFTWTDGRPEWMAGEEGTERMSKAERQRLEFEAERLRWQEERKKVGQTAQKAANVRPFAHLECLKQVACSDVILCASIVMAVHYDHKSYLDDKYGVSRLQWESFWMMMSWNRCVGKKWKLKSRRTFRQDVTLARLPSRPNTILSCPPDKGVLHVIHSHHTGGMDVRTHV